MAKKSKSIVRVEVQLPDRAKAEANFKRMIAQLVEQKVSEAMENGADRVLQPWFQPQQIAYEIKRRQTVTEQKKWTYYFEDWGCIVCSSGTLVRRGTTRYIDAEKFAALQKQGLSLVKIAQELGVKYGTLWRFSKGSFRGKYPFARPESLEAETRSDPARHRALGMCFACHSKVVGRLESTLRKHALAPHRMETTFMDSVRLAREAVAPSLAVLQAEAAKDRRDK